jgi:hypothetical protein
VLLFDLEKDLGKRENLAKNFPVMVKKLKARMFELDGEIERNASKPWFRE